MPLNRFLSSSFFRSLRISGAGEFEHDDVMLLKQGSLTLAHDGEGGIVHGQVMVLVRHERGILFDGVEVTIGRGSPIAPVSRCASIRSCPAMRKRLLFA